MCPFKCSSARGAEWALFTLMAIPGVSQGQSLDWDMDAVLAAEKLAPFHSLDGESFGWNTELRRLKGELKWEISKAWDVEISGDYQTRDDEDDIEWSDVRVRWQAPDGLEVAVGQFVEPFGLERLTGYTKLSVTERAMSTSVFAPGRSIGLSVSQTIKDWGWSVGGFKERDHSSSPRGLSGRVTRDLGAPGGWQGHIGTSFTHKWGRGGELVVRDRAEVYTGDNVIRSPSYDFDTFATLGLETQWAIGSMTATGEFMVRQIALVNESEIIQEGGYVQAAYLFNGEERKHRQGRLNRFRPKARWGGIEGVVRYSAIDLRDEGVGMEAYNVLIGLNYYWKTTLIVRGNLLLPGVSGQTEQVKPEGTAISLRVILRT